MIIGRLTMAFLILISIAGCGGKRQLTRDILPFEAKSTRPAVSVGALGDTFTGRLNLLYDRALRGSVDSRIWIGQKHIAFNTTRRRFLILDRETGETIFQIKTRKGFVFGPAISDSTLILIRRSPFGRVESINLYSGKTIAEREINEIRSEPIIIEGGRMVFSMETGATVSGLPKLAITEELIFGAKTGVAALSLPSLKPVWKCELQGEVNLISSANDQVIYVVSGAREVVAVLSVKDGEQLWSYQTTSDIVCSPDIGKFIYINTADGQLMALDKMTGIPVWIFKTAFPCRGGAVEADGRLYFGTGEGKVLCLSVADGSKNWEFQTGGVVAARPAVVGRAVIIGSKDRHLYSLDSGSGRLLDKRSLEGPVTGAVAVWGNRIYATCRNNRLYCFEVN